MQLRSNRFHLSLDFPLIKGETIAIILFTRCQQPFITKKYNKDKFQLPQEIPPKLCPKIILEGTRLTHKTDIAFFLNDHARFVGPKKYRYHSPIISAEWCAFTNFPWGRGLVNFEPQEEALAMETYHTWVRLFELQKYYSWTIDRFHISTQIYQASQGREHDFGWLEERLLWLGFGIVLLTRTADSFADARKERLKVSGKPSQYDDIEIFIKEQEDFRRRVNASILPHTEIDVSDGDLNRVADTITDWMGEKRLLGFYDK